MTPSSCVKLVIPGRLEFLRVVDRVSETVSEHMGFDDNERDAIAISVIEASTNAIQHGCGGDEAKIVTISYVMECDSLRITVLDQGGGFDPQSKECRVDEVKECRGRGLAIIKSLMDEVCFDFNQGTLVTMLKRRSSDSKNGGA